MFFNFWSLLLKMYIFAVVTFFSYLVVIHSISPPPHFGGVGQLSVPNFEKRGSENKTSAWGSLNSSCNRYLPGELTNYVSCQKNFQK